MSERFANDKSCGFDYILHLFNESKSVVYILFHADFKRLDQPKNVTKMKTTKTLVRIKRMGHFSLPREIASSLA